MRQLIDLGKETEVTCDNTSCGYSILQDKGDNPEQAMSQYVNKPCPQCGTSLCTPKDYLNYVRMNKTAKWINRWFSWITIFYGKDAGCKSVEVHSHNDGVVSIKETDK